MANSVAKSLFFEKYRDAPVLKAGFDLIMTNSVAESLISKTIVMRPSKKLFFT
jgi:hypothetical protein